MKIKKLLTSFFVLSLAAFPTLLVGCSKISKDEKNALDNAAHEMNSNLNELVFEKGKEELNNKALLNFKLLPPKNFKVEQINTYIENDFICSRASLINANGKSIIYIFKFKIKYKENIDDPIVPPTPSPDPIAPIVDVDPKTSTELLKFAKTQKWTSIKYSKIKYDNSNTYYAECEGLKGKELFEKIFSIQQTKTRGIGSYNDLWTTYKRAWTDKFFEDDNTILDIYSENPNGEDPYTFIPGKNQDKGKHSKESDSYNREHMIPQSWFDKVSPTVSDCHFIFPTDAWVNEKRGNDPHFWVEKPNITTKNGTKIKPGTATEVIDFFKGDTARAYFYFQITHKNANLKQGPRVFKDMYPYFQKEYLDCYRIWNKFDPIDICEIYRNNKIAEEQGGIRNPFIDYPNLVKLIFDDTNTDTFKNLGVAISLEN